MNTTKTAILSTLAVLSIAAASGTAIAASKYTKAMQANQASQMKVSKARTLKKLQYGGGASKARECTWTNENIAECSEEIGDTIVFTCFDRYGHSIGC